MKKVISLISVGILVGSLGFIVCSAASAAPAQKFKLKLSHQMAATHTLNDTSKKFAELVKEKTKGNVEVEVFPSASLGSERENAEALKTGAITT